MLELIEKFRTGEQRMLQASTTTSKRKREEDILELERALVQKGCIVVRTAPLPPPSPASPPPTELGGAEPSREASQPPRPPPPPRAHLLLPCDRYRPRWEEHYVGNSQARVQVREWLRAVLARMLQGGGKKTSLEQAALLIYGAVGTGKSSWARYAAEKLGFAVVSFSPADQGDLEHQKLDFWLRAQPSHDLRGTPIVAILDDADELLKAYPRTRCVSPRCTVILTAGSVVDAALRRSCHEAVRFDPLSLREATQVVRRVIPGASDEQAELAYACAGGDIRQLQFLAELRSWNCSSTVDMSSNRGCDLARAALLSASSGGAPLRSGARMVAVASEETDENAHFVAEVLQYNFPMHCQESPRALENYATVCGDAASLDASGCLRLMPLVVRGKGLRFKGALEMPPAQSAAASSRTWHGRGGGSSSSGADALGEERAPMGALAPAAPWVERRRRFLPGDDLAAQLLGARLGWQALEHLSLREHRSGEALQESYLSRACMMSAARALELREFAEQAQAL